MKYVYGPVPSRRLGQSLGIDPIPLKTCNWNCVYCQLGRSKPLINQRSNYVAVKDILREIELSLDEQKSEAVDWITIVGSGEPTLNLGIGWLIHEVKMITDLPVAVITNGSLLYLPWVRDELARADAVLPSLDAGERELYIKINRPHPEITFERHVEGLCAFSKQFKGALWLEVMLIGGLNDTKDALMALSQVIRRIQPDEIHLNLPTRPPVETWVLPPDAEGLIRAKAILGEHSRVIQPVDGLFELGEFDDVVDAVVGIITRHPMHQEELERTLDRWSPGEVERALAKLAASGKAQIVERYGIRFWSAAPAFFPEEDQSQATAPDRWRKPKGT